MKAMIFCSSDDTDVSRLNKIDFKDYFIICADGGIKLMNKLNIVPDIWVGDMDSSRIEINKKTEKILYPKDKDMTDSEIAVSYALKKGYKEILLIGATGGRLDHEFGNYCLLKYILKNGGFGTIINSKNRIFMTDKSIKIFPVNEKYISFFPFGDGVDNFSVKNVKYELKNYKLTNYLTYTVSNEFIDNTPCEIEFKEGYVLIICSND